MVLINNIKGITFQFSMLKRVHNIRIDFGKDEKKIAEMEGMRHAYPAKTCLVGKGKERREIRKRKQKHGIVRRRLLRR